MSAPARVAMLIAFAIALATVTGCGPDPDVGSDTPASPSATGAVSASPAASDTAASPEESHTPGAAEVPTTAPDAAADAGDAPAEKPEDAVTAFYEAMATEDTEKVSAAMTSGGAWDFDPRVFDTWDPDFSWRVVDTDAGDAEATVVVHEIDGGLLGGTVTFHLLDEGGWKVDAWQSTAIEDME